MREITVAWLENQLKWSKFEANWQNIGFAATVKAEYEAAKAKYDETRKMVVRKGRPIGWRKDGSHKVAV